MRSCPTCRRAYIDSQSVCPLDQAALGSSDGTKQPAALGKELGSYRLIALLGKGGTSSIYIGAHTRLNRYVAIKLLRRELDKRKENITRFFEEARTLNRIKHPNIVESIDLIEDVVDGAYCVMELLDGPELRARFAAGPLPLASAIQIAVQIADALAAAHALEIVHADLKPENVITLQRGERDDIVKLIDFGGAQISVERTGGIPFGTAAYMAPEQAAGARIDGRADVYALGVILYEMIAGEHPFPSSTDNEYVLRHADDEPVPPSTLRAMPPALETVILRCLAKQPADRFPTAEAAAAALRAIELDAAPVQRAHRSGGKAKWIAAVALLLAGGAAAAILVPRYLRDADPSSQTAPPVAAVPSPVAPVVAAPTVGDVPATVTIEFTSTPSGATVTREGETVPLGTTPFSAALARSDRPGSVHVELDGHQDQDIEVSLTDSGKIDIVLPRRTTVVTQPAAKATERKKTAGDGKKSKVQREGVMDPFAN